MKLNINDNLELLNIDEINNINDGLTIITGVGLIFSGIGAILGAIWGSK